jgi:hypothetical protein
VPFEPGTDLILDPEGSASTKVNWLRELPGSDEIVNLRARVWNALKDICDFYQLLYCVYGVHQRLLKGNTAGEPFSRVSGTVFSTLCSTPPDFPQRDALVFDQAPVRTHEVKSIQVLQSAPDVVHDHLQNPGDLVDRPCAARRQS